MATRRALVPAVKPAHMGQQFQFVSPRPRRHLPSRPGEGGGFVMEVSKYSGRNVPPFIAAWRSLLAS